MINPFKDETARQYWLDNIRDNNLPRNLECSFLSNFQTTDGWQTNFKELIAKYIDNYPVNTAVDGQRWLMLVGHVGSGKTRTACTIANELMARNYRVKYIDAYSLFTDIKQGYAKFEDRLQNYTSDDYEILIIDEVGMTKMSESDYTSLFVILNERYKKSLPVILCSNMQVEEFLGDAIQDRINEVGITYTFPERSYRGVITEAKYYIEDLIRGNF